MSADPNPDPGSKPQESHISKPLPHPNQHSLDVATILSSGTPKIVTLVVGPHGDRVPCHRNLLAYFSDVFKGGLMGNFKESREDIFALPEDDPDDIKCFVTWAYTGELLSSHKALNDTIGLNDTPFTFFKLWVLGDRLLAPKFVNAAIAVLFVWLEFPDSQLRLFVLDVILVEGPFSTGYPEISNEERGEWTELIGEGGDFVIDVVTQGGFSNYKFNRDGPDGSKPYHAKNRQKYLKEELGIPARDWVALNEGEGSA